jgi:hypothetical protein
MISQLFEAAQIAQKEESLPAALKLAVESKLKVAGKSLTPIDTVKKV